MKNDLNNKEETFHENSHAKRREFNNKLLVLVIILALVMIAGAVVIGMVYYHEDSYEHKMARFEKVATEFKETLGPNNRIITERIDSIVQKVYYLIPTEEGYGNSINNIKDNLNPVEKQFYETYIETEHPIADNVFYTMYVKEIDGKQVIKCSRNTTLSPRPVKKDE